MGRPAVAPAPPDFSPSCTQRYLIRSWLISDSVLFDCNKVVCDERMFHVFMCRRTSPLFPSVQNAGSSSAEGKDGSPEPNPTSSAVFRGLTQDEWEYFMHLVRQRIRESVHSGVWRQGPKPGAKNMPGMSCPRF